MQALLKKQVHDTKKKGNDPGIRYIKYNLKSIDICILTRLLEIELKKQKEALLAKRVELKSDRKARAMASRTKDNFKGYNGVPVLDSPNKRRTSLELQEERAMNQDRFRNASIDPEDDEDNYEYEQSDSEPDQEPEAPRASKPIGNSVKPSFRKASAPSKPPLAFADLLKLAEKKQHEPVDLKPKTVKKDERLRTADEMRELELERKAKRQGKDRGTDRERDRSQPSSISVKKGTMERDHKGGRPQKNSIEKPSVPSGSGKKPNQTKNMDKGHSSSKTDRARPRVSQNDRDRPKTSLSGSSGVDSNKVSSTAASSRMPAKQGPTTNSFSQKSSAPSDLKLKKESSLSLQRRASGTPSEAGQKFLQGNTQQTRPSQGGSARPGPPAGRCVSGKGEPVRPGMNSAAKPSVNAQSRPSLSRPPRAENHLEARPGATFRTKGNVPQVRPGGSAVHGPPGSSAIRAPGLGVNRPAGGGPVPGRSSGNIGSGPGRPKCTVVSETISSKNVGGSRPVVPPRMGLPQRPGIPPRPGMPPRPMMNRPPGETVMQTMVHQ